MFEHSCLADKPELDIFEQLPTQAAVEEGYHVEHLPRSNPDDGPLKFEISGDSNDYIDLKHSYLRMELKIVKQDGSDIADSDVVGVINGIGHTLFKQIDVSLNDTLVSDSSNLQHYRSLIETNLSYGPGAKGSQLSLSLYSKDTAGKMDDVADGNLGLVHRRGYTKESRVVEVISRPHIDLCHQRRYLINGVDLKLQLIRNTDPFVLMAALNSTFKVKIVNASFFVRKVKVNAGIQLGHIEKMDKKLQPAVYPIRRVMMKSFTVPQGSMSVNEESLFSGQLPKRIVLGLVPSANFEGRYHLNPFNFANFGLKYCALYVDGKMVPQKPLMSEFGNHMSLRSYFTLLESTGKSFTDEGIDITRDDYEKGYAMLAFDLSPDLEDNGCYHLIKKGNIRLELKFETGLTTPVNVVVYSEFDSSIKIDKNRQVMMDYYV